MFHVIKAGQAHATIIHDLVHQIYYPTYAEILSPAQIDFMLNKSYTIAALESAMLDGQDFYLLQHDQDEKFVGFMALKSTNHAILKIEKLYLLPETQGKGCGKLMISYAEAVARASQKTSLALNVNRGNKAYFFYLKQGFKVIQEIDIPYYGYVLDDYIMEKEV